MSERELFLAVIQRAIEDTKVDLIRIRCKDKEVAEKDKRRSLLWLSSNSEEERSFCWYCKMLNLDPQWVRRKLRMVLRGEERKDE